MMKKVGVGDRVPDFTFECTDPSLRSFADLKGKNVVLYFYPKDNTPGCTLEGKNFRDLESDFARLHTQVLGVSRDTLVCHQKFQSKYNLSFPLITDPDEKLCVYFDVIIQKNFFKRLILGIERSTFLIDSQGTIKQIWRNVKVKGHAQAVLEAASKL